MNASSLLTIVTHALYHETHTLYQLPQHTLFMVYSAQVLLLVKRLHFQMSSVHVCGTNTTLQYNTHLMSSIPEVPVGWFQPSGLCKHFLTACTFSRKPQHPYDPGPPSFKLTSQTLSKCSIEEWTVVTNIKDATNFTQFLGASVKFWLKSLFWGGGTFSCRCVRWYRSHGIVPFLCVQVHMYNIPPLSIFNNLQCPNECSLLYILFINSTTRESVPKLAHDYELISFFQTGGQWNDITCHMFVPWCRA